MKNTLLIFCLILSLSVFSVEKKKWDVIYPTDIFTDKAMLDLSYLNEKYAGEHGFIKLSEDGNSFVNSVGKPVRFWAANIANSLFKQSSEELDSLGRFLAKMGFNMTRYHGAVNPKGKTLNIMEADTAEIHRMWKFVAAMKKNGIYTTISPYWAHNGHMGGNVPKEWGIDGYSGKDGLWSVILFNDTLKKAYKAWVKKLYTEINPYTGIALKDDPAVGIIQIQNEDGIFFWTHQSIKPELRKIIENKFGIWLTKKYGSLENAFQQWGNEFVDGDDIPNAKIGLYNTYDMTIDQTGNKAIRLKDQMQFYIETQTNFFKEITDYYKNDLKCKQVVNAANWKTADVQRLNDLERWTNTASDVIATNSYFSPQHTGINDGWQIAPGHHYVGPSALKAPEALPVNVKQVANHPFIITESAWNMPNKHQAEGPFLVSAYQSLSGLDAFYWFTVGNRGYSESPYFKHLKDTAMTRWDISSPGGIGMMPANALIFRNGYIKESSIVIHEERSAESLFNREIPLISEESSFDPNRDTEFIGLNNSKKQTISPLAFLAGRVEVKYNGDPSKSFTSDELKYCIDLKNKTVKSTTKELNFDYGNGIFSENSPFVQGVCGFLNTKNDFELQDVKIHSENDYASIQVVSIDKKPINTSNKLLVQVGTTYLPTGWNEEKVEFSTKTESLSGFKILNTGKMPWQGQNVEVTVEINNPQLSKATLLDAAGYAVKKLKIKNIKSGIKIKLPLNSMYVIVE